MSGISLAQDSDHSTWLTYKNDVHGFSFSYPRTIAVATRPVEFFHIAGLVDCIELVDWKNTNKIILRILISEPSTNPGAVVKDAAYLKKVCKKYKEMAIGGRTAINCITCGRGACDWEIVIPGAKQFEIFTLLTKEREAQEPKDNKYPLRSIIESINWLTAR